MFAAPPSFPSLFSLQYLRFISMFDNCILCCSSRVPFQLRCPFKTDFSSRSKRGFVLPIHRFLAIHAISMHFLLSHSFFPTSKRERERDHISSDEFIHESNFFSLCSLGILGERGKKLKSLLITILEKLCKLKRMKKKRKIAFSLLLSEDDTQNVEEDRPTETGRSEVVGLKIPIIHRLDSIMKPSWSDGRRNTNCPLSVLQLSRLACSRERLVGFPPILFPRTRRIESGRIDEQMEGEIKRPHNYLNGVATHHYRFDA